MTEHSDLEAQRRAHDRRSKAWVNLVIGALIVWIVGFGGLQADATVWNVVGYAGIVVGGGMVTFGLILFQKPRP